MSTKWTKAKIQTKPPPVCKPPPKPPPPGPPPPPPTQLSAAAVWVDHDPDAYAHHAESFELTLTDLAGAYSGASGPSVPRLEIALARVGASDYWTAVLTVYDPYRDPETQTWLDEWVNPEQPFLFAPPPIVAIPGDDWQQVFITA